LAILVAGCEKKVAANGKIPDGTGPLPAKVEPVSMCRRLN
jgi:hypothetical protein